MLAKPHVCPQRKQLLARYALHKAFDISIMRVKLLRPMRSRTVTIAIVTSQQPVS